MESPSEETGRARRTAHRPGPLEQPALRTPRSAAYAGIVFSLLLATSLVTIRLALPERPADSPDLLTSSPERDILLAALSLVPFAAIAFLWFVGVVRDRIGPREDASSRPSSSGAACCSSRCCS